METPMTLLKAIPAYVSLAIASQKMRKLYDSLPEGDAKDRANMIAAGVAALQLEVAGWMDELEEIESY